MENQTLEINPNDYRTLRQQECVRKWIANKCRGTIVAATG